MPNLNIVPTQSLVSPANVAGGNGGQGLSEMASGGLSALSQGGRLYEQHQDEQARVWAGAAASDFHVKQLQATQDQRQAAVDAVASGQPVPDMTGSFLKSYDEDSGAIIASAPNSRAKQYLQTSLTQTRTALAGQVVGQQAQLTRDWKLSTADATVQNGAKVVQQDPGQYDTQMGNVLATMPHIDPVTDAAHAIKARGVLTNAAATSALDNNPDGLKADTGKALGENGFKGPTGVSYIDAATPDQVETWNKLATVKIAMRDRVAQTAQDAREAAATKSYNDLVTFTNSGKVPDLDYLNQVRQATTGTSQQESAKALLNVAISGGGFGSQSLPRQQATLTALDAESNTSGSNPEREAMLSQFRTIHSAQTEAYKNDPWSAATQFAHAPAQPVQNLQTPQKGLALVQQRVAMLPTIEAASGAPASPFQPAEAQQMTKLLEALPTDQQATLLTSIGQMAGSQERVSAIAKQFGDKDGTLGLAMAYAGAPGKTAVANAAGTQVAQLILDGDRALKQRTSAEDMTKQTGWKATIATALKGVYPNPQLEDAAIDAATKIAAGRSANGQGEDLDVAVKLATGGIIQHGAAGAPIPLPYGMQTASDFEKRIAAITPDTLQAQAPNSMVVAGGAMVPLQAFVRSLPNATLVHAGQGRYNVRAGNSYVTNTNGAPITIQVAP